MRVHFRVVLCSALAAFIVGCGQTTAPFVWVDAMPLPPVSAGTDYIIGVGDLLSVQVWEQEKMSTKARVRTDGKISIPFLYDVVVVNKTPGDVARELEVALKPYMLVPKVNVVVDEPRPLTVSVIGQVARPGQYVVDRAAGISQVLAAAGGLSAFAHKDRIFVIREVDQKQERIRFKYESLTGAIGAASKFRVQNGDVVVVE